MRVALFLALSAMSAVCHADDIGSIDAAWAYLIKPGKSDQWVVIGSRKNDGYVQCENRKDFLLCPFPVWLKALPEVKRTAPKTSRGTPFPETPGSKATQYMSPQKVLLLKETLKRHGLKAKDVYSQVVDERGRDAGTSYDIRVVLERSFTGFVPLVEDIFRSVFDTTVQDGYAFDTDS